MKSLCLSALRALLVVSLLSNGAYSFYVITNSDCPGCEDRLRAVKANFPGSSFVEYELALNETRARFNEIDTIIGEAYLPMPLIGVFREGELIAVVGGGQSPEDWETILNATNEGVPLYVENSMRRAEYIKTIADPESVARLEELFASKHMEDGATGPRYLMLPLTVAAAIDAVNPCAISVLLVMLTFVFYGVERGSVLRTGLSFCAAVFITYYLIGLGLVRVFAQVLYVRYVTVAFAIILGTIRIAEFFLGERRHLPGAFTREITRRLEKVSDPRTAFAAGVVTAALIMPCSSAPYFLALDLISERSTALVGYALIGYYNLIIVAPLLAITVMIHVLGVKTMDLKLRMIEGRRWINLLLGLGLVALGLLVLAGLT